MKRTKINNYECMHFNSLSLYRKLKLSTKIHIHNLLTSLYIKLFIDNKYFLYRSSHNHVKVHMYKIIYN